MSALSDFIGDVGYVADTPGALFRGLLAGRAGERVSGSELLPDSLRDDSLLSSILGFGANVLADPLTLFPLGLGGMMVGRGLGQATARAGQITKAQEELAALSGVAGKFSKAADAQQAAKYASQVGAERALFGTGAQGHAAMTYRPDIIEMFPGLEDVGKLAQRATMPGSRLGPSLEKAYSSASPEVGFALEQMQLGRPTATGGMSVVQNIRRDPKAYKLVAPPAATVRGSKLFPGEVPSLRPYGSEANYLTRLPMDVSPPLMTPSPYERLLREAAERTSGQSNELLAQLAALQNPQNYGLAEDMFIRGFESPLLRAILLGSGVGGGYALGREML